MPALYEIRAGYDTTTIVVYQAFPKAIAEPALRAGGQSAGAAAERACLPVPPGIAQRLGML